MDKKSAPWGMAIVMCLVNAVAFIDRTSLPLLVQPITRDLKISDTQMSLLIGIAFILNYSIGGSLSVFSSTGSPDGAFSRSA